MVKRLIIKTTDDARAYLKTQGVEVEETEKNGKIGFIRKITCPKCGGTGHYPSMMDPPGRCRACYPGPAIRHVFTTLISYAKEIRKQELRELNRQKKADQELANRWIDLLAWARENREVLPLLKIDHQIPQDMRNKLIVTGARWGLSEKQVALLKKIKADVEKGPEKHVPVPVDGERITFEGLVVSVKEVEDRYSYGSTTWKMVVKVETDAGSWMVYGTAPDALMGATQGPLKGCRIRVTAKVKRGDRDEYFGFFSRPTKPVLLEEVGLDMSDEAREAAELYSSQEHRI